jgi:uncharacterized membrane protein
MWNLMWNRGYDGFGMMDRLEQHPWVAYAMCGIGILIFLAIVITGIILLVKYEKRRSAHAGPMNHPMQPPKNAAALKMLDERYAKSEIGDEEYKTKKANLLS